MAAPTAGLDQEIAGGGQSVRRQSAAPSDACLRRGAASADAEAREFRLDLLCRVQR